MEPAVSVKAKFKIGIATLQCNCSVLGGPTNVEEGDPLTSTVEAVTFTECNEGCKVEALELPYESRYEARGASGSGNFTLIGPKFGFECPEEEFCIYSANRLYFPVVAGGAPAVLSSPPLGMTKLVGVGGCLMTGVWEGTTPAVGTIKYVFETPTALYVTG